MRIIRINGRRFVCPKNEQEPEVPGFARFFIFPCGEFLLHVRSRENKLQRLAWHKGALLRKQEFDKTPITQSWVLM